MTVWYFFQGTTNALQVSVISFSHLLQAGKNTHTGKATKGKVQDIGEVNKVMPLPLPSSDRVRG